MGITWDHDAMLTWAAFHMKASIDILPRWLHPSDPLTSTSSPSSCSRVSSRRSELLLPVPDSTTSPWSMALTPGRCSRKTSTRATRSASTSSDVSPGERSSSSSRSGAVTHRRHQHRAEAVVSMGNNSTEMQLRGGGGVQITCYTPSTSMKLSACFIFVRQLASQLAQLGTAPATNVNKSVQLPVLWQLLYARRPVHTHALSKCGIYGS